MSQSSEKNLLRFGCPACGIRLVVDQSIAGTEGPCPSCGARIIAPPLDVSRSLVSKEAAPVVIKPRSVAQVSTSPTPPVADTHHGSEAPKSETKPEPARKSARRSRTVSPEAILSDKHEEQKNLKVFLKMVLAATLVVGIALGVYYFLNQSR